jgi:penicillin-binding protein 2
VDPSGQSVNRLGQVAEEPASDVVSTIDMRLQRQAQAAMRGYKGAAVVLERDTGRVLAMVSNPGFDPNYFDPNNYNANQGNGLGDLLNSQDNPLVNRATGDHGSGYPLGSIFKIIDLAAALESGEFKVDDTYDCQHYFKDIVGRVYTDWTLEKKFPPSGVLNLPQGLMRSCDPWFYHIGLKMFNDGKGKDIATMARGFGLGSKTGLDVLQENAGNVPEPSNEVQAVEQAIGQDKLQVTPLQVADFIAAVGNGGTLYTPQMVEKVVKADGTETNVFQPKVRGKLPVKPETLQVIQDAMRSVVANKRGTAYDAFRGFGIPTFGKTGTAQVDYGDPHAWFAAYTDEGNPDRPDVAVVVLAENTGEGADFAAPIARRILEVYFYGHPIRVFPWEEKINRYKEATPTPEPGQQDTPTP